MKNPFHFLNPEFEDNHSIKKLYRDTSTGLIDVAFMEGGLPNCGQNLKLHHKNFGKFGHTISSLPVKSH